MPIGTTTVATLQGTIATRVVNTTSDVTSERTTWQRVRSVQDVPSAARNFYIEISGQRLADEGIYTNFAATYEADLKIWCSYIGMRDVDSLKSADARQLWTRLSVSGGAITGLWNIKHDDPMWEDGDSSEEGTRWGAHTFSILYLLEQP